jgi:hypothetical protein
MDRTAWLQNRSVQKSRDVLGRWERQEPRTSSDLAESGDRPRNAAKSLTLLDPLHTVALRFPSP